MGRQRKKTKEKNGMKRKSCSPSLSPVRASSAGPAGACTSADEHTGWCGVDSDTVFMAYSVAKGCTAAAMLLLVDEGKLDWSEPLDQVWPDLACQYATSKITRNGGDSGGGSGITVAEAASHRLGLPGTPLPLMRFYRQYCTGGWRGLWDEGIRWAEGTPATWQPGKRARYCHLGWSFVVGGMVERKCGEHIADTVQRVAAAIGLPHCLHVGRLPPQLWHRTATLEAPPAGHNSVWSCARGQPLGLGWRVLGTIESFLFRQAGNSDLWRNSCFPSSNGFFTAHALARLFGALANQGVVYLNTNTNDQSNGNHDVVPMRLVRMNVMIVLVRSIDIHHSLGSA